MKEKKTIKRVFRTILYVIAGFTYFWSLSYFGQQYHQNHPGSGQAEKKDTLLNLGWKFHPGDNPQWAEKDFNDNTWTTVQSDSLPASYHGEVAWFRLHLKTQGSFSGKPIVFNMNQYGASEIYLDGFQIASFGKVAAERDSEECMNPGLPVHIQLQDSTTHIISVRYSDLHHTGYVETFGGNSELYLGFELSLQDEKTAITTVFNERVIVIIATTISIFLLTLLFVHLLLYLFFRRAKENLFYSIFAFGYSLFFIINIIKTESTKPYLEVLSVNAMEIMVPLVILSLLLFVYRIYNSKFPKWLWWFAVASSLLIILDGFTNWINSSVIFGSIMWLAGFAVVTMAISTYHALRKKVPGAKILGAGIGTFALFIFIMISVIVFSNNISISNIWIVAGMIIAMLSIPISMSVYLAYNFSRTNRDLSKKLQEVEDLSARTIEQEKEKQEILSKQKENLEIQVTERTREVVQQKKVIEEKNKDITDSINYAKRIQDAILPSDEQVKKMLPESFVLFKPKDIVSGDFYFFSEVQENPPLGGRGAVIVAAVDCTGHGVPGAFMSMVGYNHLKRIVNEQGTTDTSQILDELHKQVLYSMNRDMTKRDSKDGMDVAIVSIDKQKREVQFSGAVRPLYYFINGIFNEVKGERYSIAGVKEIGSAPYAATTIKASEPTTFYLFSDGFADQFGGKEGKKLMSKNFRELLASVQNKTMEEQKKFLGDFIEEWKGDKEQMDDVMVIGIKLP